MAKYNFKRQAILTKSVSEVEFTDFSCLVRTETEPKEFWLRIPPGSDIPKAGDLIIVEPVDFCSCGCGWASQWILID